MVIKILDVCEADMRKAEARFKNEVIVDDVDGEDGVYNLTFKKGCSMSTHTTPVNQLFVYNSSCEACLCLFENDFSEVHII